MTETRKYQTKFQGDAGNGYDFENVKKIDEYLDENLTVLKGFTREGNYGKQLVMAVQTDDETVLTLRSGSAVLCKQFEEEKEIGFPFKVKVVAKVSKSNNTYLTFAPPDEN